jgi:hypothetical protein
VLAVILVLSVVSDPEAAARSLTEIVNL